MEIELLQDGQIKREMDIYHHGLGPIYIICQLPGPPCFSLVITFKAFFLVFMANKGCFPFTFLGKHREGYF
jgi:hypothetical protein